ncbi:MAG: hypothetical protein ACRC01_05015, partial [Deefgea sp.]
MRRIKFALFYFPVWLFRWTKRVAIALALIFAVLAAAWQFWFVPRLNEYRPLLVEQLQKATGTSVSIGQIAGGWQLFQPQISLTQFAMGADLNSPDLVFDKLSATLSIWTLLKGNLHFSQIRLKSPVLDISRAADGAWRMGGVSLSNQNAGNHNVLNWFLAQGEIVIERGSLRFRDLRGQYPSLDLAELDFVTGQFFATHRFELAFTPPPSVGPRIKMQGRFQGKDFEALQQGSGWFKAQVPNTNLAKLMPWLGEWLPQYEFKQGQGKVDV